MSRPPAPKRPPAKNISPFLFFTLSCLAILAALGLDYLRWREGESSYIFPPSAPAQVEQIRREPLNRLVRRELTALGLADDAVHHYRDSEGFDHVMIDVPVEDYEELQTILQKSFARTEASLLSTEEQQGEQHRYVLWQVQGSDNQRLFILFSCRLPTPSDKPSPPIQTKARNRVAIVIDDMGYSLEAMRNITALGKPVTVAILPYSPFAYEVADMAHRQQLEIMLHLPLESVNDGDPQNDIRGLIHSNMGADEILRTVEANLNQVPYLAGVNNHMGSKTTADLEVMRIILNLLKGKGLYFLDSKTAGNSVAYKTAQSLGLPTAYRHVFLDTINDEEHIKGKILELCTTARRRGFAVGIGHPWYLTLKALKENIHLIDQFELEAVFVSQIVN